MKRRALDRVVSALSWVPSERLGLPLIVLLAVAPAVYMLLSEAFGLPGARDAASVTGAREPGAAAQAASSEPMSEEDKAFAERFAFMTAELERAAQSHPGQVGIYIKDLARNQEWTYHADDLFPSASLIKVPVMVGVFEKIKRGDLSLNSRLKLRRRTRMGGSGHIKWQRDGTFFTVRKLLDKLIHDSDNTAMRILIDEIGMGYLQREFPKMGLVYTEIYPEGLSLSSGRVRYENYTTPREMGQLFEKIYRGQMVNGFASELMLEILKGHNRRARLAKELPVGWEIAHKTGLLRRACHDAGIVFSPEGDYVLVTLTGRNGNYHSAKGLITKLGAITYEHYKGELGLYANAPSRSGHAR